MANYSAIKAAVNAYIKANGKKEITGHILNSVLNATIDSLGRYFQFAGGALPTDDPGTPDQNVCYLAGEPGVYTNFGGITIENEEVALLFWNGEWTKQRVLLGIQEVEASVDNQVGTPSVDVSYSGGQLVLTFHNLKGETGDAAGFGTIGADINGGVGTPGVSVESSGDNTAKNLMFHFTNLKGETGVTSVVATIDDTSGTPSCQVSLVNGVLTLAFSGLKGIKGDTGVSADYPIAIYNGLDSDATDQALAAAQGKVLDGKISQLRQEVDGFVEEVTSEDYSDVLIDAERKLLESRDLAGKKTIYTDVEVKGQVTGDFIPEIEVKPGTDFVDVVIDSDGKVVEGTKQDGKKVFFGGMMMPDGTMLNPGPLFGKKWVVLGDSFTNGSVENGKITESGPFVGSRCVYPYIIANRNGMEIARFFEGGQTLAFPEDPGDFTNSVTCPTNSMYYQNIPLDADYITIYLGINDIGHASGEGGDGEDYTGVIPLGTPSDNTVNTYYGAWNVVLSWLRMNRPFAHIGIIVCNCGSSPDYRTAQIAMANKYGYMYLDLNGDERCPAMIRSSNTNIPADIRNQITQLQSVNYPSNRHPNRSAHLYESTFIENFLKSL